MTCGLQDIEEEHGKAGATGRTDAPARSPLVIGQQLSGTANFTAASAAVGVKENPVVGS